MNEDERRRKRIETEAHRIKYARFMMNFWRRRLSALERRHREHLTPKRETP